MSRLARPLTAFAALALLLGACGGGSSPAASSASSPEPGATPTSPAATSPAATDAATAAPTAAGGVPDITTGAAALANLDSYHMKITMAMNGLDNTTFAAFGDGLAMDATIVTKPEKAVDMTVSMGTTGQKLEMGYRVVGDKAWVNLGSWMEASAEDAASTIDSFSPEKMFGGFSSLSGLNAVGDETRSGVATTHYTATGSAVTSELNDTFGLENGAWTVDYWVAKDGGYPIAYTVEGKGSNDAWFSMSLEVSDINSPSNAVEEPATN